MFYTYLWLREDGTPYYVGKGSGRRAFNKQGHISNCPDSDRVLIQEHADEAEAFEAENALEKLEGFASFYGADFYGLPRNVEKITLVKESWLVPDTLPFTEDVLVPLRAGSSISWKLE